MIWTSLEIAVTTAGRKTKWRNLILGKTLDVVPEFGTRDVVVVASRTCF